MKKLPVLILCFVSIASAQSYYEKTQEPPGTIIYAAGYGVKANTGTSQDVRLKAAADACNTVGGHLVLPPGTILLDGTGGNSITLNGCWMSGSGGQSAFVGVSQGTTFNLTSTSVSPFILEANFTVSDANFYWPNQTDGITVYPALFADGGTGTTQKMRHGTIRNITIINAYDGLTITPSSSTADVKVEDSVFYAAHGLFNIHDTGDSWTFSNNRYTPGPWLNVLNSSNAVKAAIDAASTNNSIFHITSGGTAWFTSTGEVFDWRYLVLVDSGGTAANDLIDMSIDLVGTIVDSSSGGTFSNQSDIQGVVTTCGTYSYVTNTTVIQHPCFTLGADSGLRLGHLKVNQAMGDFIDTAGNNIVDIDGLVLGHIGSIADGADYYFYKAASTQQTLRMHANYIQGQASGLDAHCCHGISYPANAFSSGNLIVKDNFFNFMTDVLTASTANKVILQGNTALNTYVSGSTINLTGAGTMLYDGNYWDITPTSLLTPLGAAAAGTFTTLTASGAVTLDTGTSTSTTTIGNTAGTGSALQINAPTTLSMGTNLSQATWGTAGIEFFALAATFNDTTTGSGGVTSAAAFGLGPPTFTNTQGTANVLTNAINFYAGIPICGAGWASCTNLYSVYSAGKLFAGAGATINTGTIALNANSGTNITNIGTGSTSGTITVGGGSDAVTLNATTLSLTGTLAGTTISNYLASSGVPASFTTLSAGSGGFAVDASGNVTAASITVSALGKAPTTVSQSGIPFVLAGGTSSSMGNNGALSALTALPATIANAYVFALPGSIGNATIASVAITGTAGQFSCTCTGLAVGQYVTLSGTYGGTGSITGYVNPTLYYVSATNGTSTFTLQSSVHVAIVTTVGTPTGITYAGGGGWFFGQGSSTTAFTLFNNLYVSGTPTVPGSPTAFATTGVGAFTQTTGFLVPGPVVTITANSLGANGELDVDDTLVILNSATTKTTQIQFGNTSTDGQAYTTSAFSTNSAKINNNGVTNKQTSSLTNWVATNNTVGSYLDLTIDTTADRTAQIVLELNTAATDYMILKRYSMRLAQ